VQDKLQEFRKRDRKHPDKAVRAFVMLKSMKSRE